jgi:hypothetical protein
MPLAPAEAGVNTKNAVSAVRGSLKTSRLYMLKNTELDSRRRRILKASEVPGV